MASSRLPKVLGLDLQTIRGLPEGQVKSVLMKQADRLEMIYKLLYGDFMNMNLFFEQDGNIIFNSDKGLPFAEIYVADGSTAQAIATGATYAKLTGFTTDGSSNNCIPDASNDMITITKPGKYLVNCTINASSGGANITFKFAAFLNGVELDNVHCHRKYGGAGDLGSSSLSGIIDVTSEGLDLDIRARHDSGGSVDFTPTYMNLTILQIAGT